MDDGESLEGSCLVDFAVEGAQTIYRLRLERPRSEVLEWQVGH